MADVATTKILENDKIIVWEMTLEPGQETGVHTHSHSDMLYSIEGAAVDTIDTEGNSLGVSEAISTAACGVADTETPRSDGTDWTVGVA